jgi:peptidoglycan hydrolase CwlO-like protein
LKKVLTIITTTSLLFGGVMVQTLEKPVFADEIDDKIEEVKEKKEENKESQNEIKSDIQELNAQKLAVENEIISLENEVNETEDKINETENEIKKKNKEIKKLKKEIVKTEQRIDERDKMLKNRVKAMYVNGGTVNYLEVLLGAESFGNFLDRVITLSRIAENDKQILEEQKADKKKLEESKVEVEKQKIAVEESLIELEKLKASMKAKINTKNDLIAKINSESKGLHEELHELEDVAELLAAQETAFIKEKKRQEEEERRRREEGGTTPPPPSGNGMLMLPAQGYISDYFGTRGGNHFGVDIAKSGNVPIYAAADGTVFRSYRSSSYGEVIFITHFINGQQWTTVYAHMQEGSRRVFANGFVKRGQVIGYMGNTGDSTGQHLHFELHNGEWNDAKSNAVNPLNYIK